MSTAGKVITCKAAVIWEENTPFVIEEIEVQPPKAGEVRVKIHASGICHSDRYNYGDLDRMCPFPTIRGHEGAGVVESVGEGVTSLQPGDHVITAVIPQCYKCHICLSGKSNVCEGLYPQIGKGVMRDGTSRFSCRGKTIHHYLGCSSFSEYTVGSEHSLVKINPEAPLDKVCILGCGVITGYGSAVNTAKIQPGSTCAVWGLGAVGLAAVMGCRELGASKIYGIDVNPRKFEMGKPFGLTDFVNPLDVPEGKTLPQYLTELTGGLGFDYTFDCVGKAEIALAAIQSSNRLWGKTVIVGVDVSNKTIDIPFGNMLSGRILMGSTAGHVKPKDDIPKLVEKYKQKKFLVDEFITFDMKLDQINEAFENMLSGKSVHTVLHMDN